MINKFYYEEEAGWYLLQGVNRLADLIKPTYGPLGSHIILGNPLSTPISIQSGNGIIEEIDLNHPGAELAKESIIRMAEMEGDGTTTAIILFSKLLNGAFLRTMAGANPVRLRKAMMEEAARVTDYVTANAVKVSDVKAAAGLASAEDEEMKSLMEQAFGKVTAEGIVTVRDGKKVTSYVEAFDSLEIDQGYISDEMITNPADSAAVLEYPYILLTDQVIAKAEDIAPAMNLARKAGKSLFVMAQDITGEALATLVVNIRNKKLSSAAVRATAFGERRKEILQDLAVAVGAAVISSDLGDRLDRIEVSQLGEAASVRMTKNHTYLYGGKGGSSAISQRISRIRSEIAASIYEVDRVNLKNRLARMEGGAAVIYVGAPTDTELRERRQKVKSTVAAVKAILDQGAVPGGGIALFLAAEELYKEPGELEKKDREKMKNSERGMEEEKAARRLFKEMLREPLVQLLHNAGCSPCEVIGKLNRMPSGYGYDVMGKRFGNMLDMEIADAAGTLCRAVETAASLTGMIITAGAVIREDKN